MNEREITLALVGGVLVLALLYISSEEAGHSEGKMDNPATHPEVAMAYDALDFGAPAEAKGLLDASVHLHGWHPGYDPSPGAQESIKGRHRYPVHCGGNLTAVMTRGLDPMMFPNPGSNWATSPPSEVDM